MEPTEDFNIRWDDFEANTRVALKELLDEKEFCDVTLACDGKQVSAHKVILAGGSTFFQQILKQNPHPHPLLYLKGVRYEYLLSILDFVYTGEANINQKELHSFLDVAKDLQIKGLTENNPSRKDSTKEGETIPSTISHQEEHSHSAAKKEAPSHDNTQGSQSTCEGGPIDNPLAGNIKVELDDTIHPTAFFGMETKRAGLNDREDMMDFETEVPNSYETGSIFKKGPMTADWCEQMRYDGEGDENRNEQDFSTVKNARKVCSVCVKSFRDNFMLKEHMRTHTGEKPFQCLFCLKTFKKSSNLKKHTKIHAGEKPHQCLICFKRFTQLGSLKDHLRIHTGEKPFQCMVCFKRFTQSGTLSVHKKRCSKKLGE